MVDTVIVLGGMGLLGIGMAVLLYGGWHMHADVVEQLGALMEKLDEQDDQLVEVINALTMQVDDLTDALAAANVGDETVLAAVAKLRETTDKFDEVLSLVPVSKEPEVTEPETTVAPEQPEQPETPAV